MSSALFMKNHQVLRQQANVHLAIARDLLKDLQKLLNSRSYNFLDRLFNTENYQFVHAISKILKAHEQTLSSLPLSNPSSIIHEVRFSLIKLSQEIDDVIAPHFFLLKCKMIFKIEEVQYAQSLLPEPSIRNLSFPKLAMEARAQMLEFRK